MNVLIVTTSCSMLAPDHPTGLWLEEFAVPFTAFSEAGAPIRVVSPRGAAVPIDPKTDPTEKDREKWPDALEALTTTERLADVAADVAGYEQTGRFRGRGHVSVGASRGDGPCCDRNN
jgi:putative intracellular protease/amidase